jgi:SWI/SNF related-matrix-associated actin-dependent regulator of chromatin subfamily C
MEETDGENTEAPHPLLRDPAAGMHPVSLLTGFVGPRGERIRHPVHEGALRLPPEALEIICNNASPRAPQEYTLPALDSVLRPSLDPALPFVTVTEVRNEEIVQEEVSPEDGTIQTTKYMKVVSNTRVIVRPPTDDSGMERIRGGGVSGDGDNVAHPSAPPDSNVASSLPTDAAMEAATNPSALESRPTPMDTAAPVLLEASFATKPPEMAPPVLDAPVPTVAVMETAPSSATPLVAAPANALPSNVPPMPSVAVSMLPVAGPPASTAAPPHENAAPPTIVPAAATSMMETVLHRDPQVIPLAKRPLELWEALKRPDAETAPPPSTPDWYHPATVSSLERAALSEWFDGSAAHRTPESYRQAREKIITMSRSLGPAHFLTGTLVRRTIPGDIGSLLRLHSFLTTYSLINADAINESTPTPMVLLKPSGTAVHWNDEAIRNNLLHAVVEQTRKRPKMVAPSTPIDWEAVASSVGGGVTASECERQFLVLPIPSTPDGSVTPDPTETAGSALDRAAWRAARLPEGWAALVRQVDPTVLSAVTEAAFRCTNDVVPAQQGARIGLLAQEAADQARSQEHHVARVLAEIVDVRMQKLEHRLSCLDEVEGMLEAERVALELERRDLYTARCRHWFGGT